MSVHGFGAHVMEGAEGLWSEDLGKLKKFMELQFEEQRSMLRDLSLQVQSALQESPRLDTSRLNTMLGGGLEAASSPSEDPLKSADEGTWIRESDSEPSDRQERKTITKKGSLQSLDSTDTFVSDFLRRKETQAQNAADRLTQQRFNSEQSATRSTFEMGGLKSWAKRVVASHAFVYSVTVVIVFNLVILGIEVDVSTGLGQNDIPSWFGVCNGVVVGFFTAELSLNLYAQGLREFFCGRERWWNLFDLLIIILSLLESALDLWVAASTASGQSQPVSPSHLRAARSIRLARALRGIRVMRLLRYVSALRTLVLSIMSSMSSLIWTLVLLLLLFYSFGVLFTQLVTDECRIQAILLTDDVNSVPNCTNEYAKLWQNIPESMLTLFMAITGGIDWVDAMRPLEEISMLAVLCLVMYITITYFAIVNVITGVFVTTAMETTSADKDLAVMRQLQKHQAQVEDLESLFTEISGGNFHREVSIEQISKAMSIPRFKAFLQAIGIDAEEVGILYKLLDADADGLVCKEEFVKGCLNLQGTAKSLHLARMSYENKLTRRMLKQVCRSVADLSTKMEKMVMKQELLQV